MGVIQSTFVGVPTKHNDVFNQVLGFPAADEQIVDFCGLILGSPKIMNEAEQVLFDRYLSYRNTQNQRISEVSGVQEATIAATKEREFIIGVWEKSLNRMNATLEFEKSYLTPPEGADYIGRIDVWKLLDCIRLAKPTARFERSKQFGYRIYEMKIGFYPDKGCLKIGSLQIQMELPYAASHNENFECVMAIEGFASDNTDNQWNSHNYYYALLQDIRNLHDDVPIPVYLYNDKANKQLLYDYYDIRNKLVMRYRTSYHLEVWDEVYWQ